MTQTIFQFISPLVILYFIVVAFLAYLLVKVPQKYKLKWFGIPIILVCGLFSYEIYVSKLGRPVPFELPEDEEFELVDARMSLNKQLIELWIVEGTMQSRLIVIPFDKALFKNIKEALERGNKSGVPQIGKRKRMGGQGGNGDDLAGSDFQFYDFPYEKEYPKDQQQIPDPVLVPMPPEPPSAPSAPGSGLAPPPILPQEEK